MQRTVLIMAGGHGERFWPSSRKSLPKQFLCLTDESRTMIQLTVDRVRLFTDINNVFIATNQDYRTLVAAQIPDLPLENILCEPIGRNTAPCIALGGCSYREKIRGCADDSSPPDHLIQMPSMFGTRCRKRVTAEDGDKLVTIGITPDEPETGYGYIHFSTEPETKQGVQGGSLCGKAGSGNC